MSEHFKFFLLVILASVIGLIPFMLGYALYHLLSWLFSKRHTKEAISERDAAIAAINARNPN